MFLFLFDFIIEILLFCFQWGLSEIEDTLAVMPESSVIFHWPRLNKNQLLCVKMADLEESRWSGGFGIEEIQSFHISV